MDEESKEEKVIRAFLKMTPMELVSSGGIKSCVVAIPKEEWETLKKAILDWKAGDGRFEHVC